MCERFQGMLCIIAHLFQHPASQSCRKSWQSCSWSCAVENKANFWRFGCPSVFHQDGHLFALNSFSSVFASVVFWPSEHSRPGPPLVSWKQVDCCTVDQYGSPNHDWEEAWARGPWFWRWAFNWTFAWWARSLGKTAFLIQAAFSWGLLSQKIQSCRC